MWYETGETISAHNRRTQAQPPRYEALTLTLAYEDRAALYARIDQRVEEMMAQGLPDEVRRLLAAGVPADCTAMQAIGYKELTAAVQDPAGDLDAAAEQVKLRSRQYAKRQLSWFRRNQQAHWIFHKDPPDFSAAVQDSTEFLRAKGLR